MRACLCLAVLFGAIGSASAEQIKIGILTDLSGPMAFWGQESTVGAQLAQSEINAAGGELELIIEDHQLQPKNALSGLQKLVEINGIDAVYSEFTPTSAAIMPVAASKNIPVIFAAAAVSPLNSSKFALKTFLDYVSGCRSLAEYWKSKGIRRVAILKPTMEFGDICLQGLRQVYPQPIIEEYNVGDDVKTQLLKFKSKGAEAVINATFEPDLRRMFKTMQDINWQPITGSEGDGVSVDQVKLFPRMLEKHTVFTFSDMTESFIAKIVAKSHSHTPPTTSGAALTYLHVKQLYQAVKSCGSRDVSCVVNYVTRSAPDRLLGFEGWRERQATFIIALRTWRNGLQVEQH
ncbi:MAG: ABC transporter substrate-binding protein [Oligoflexia bacterium]|nr:ABC transporter substrate-binding protein [Oligoflexia bacterium]